MVTSLYESIPPHSKNGLEFLVYYLSKELLKKGITPVIFGTADSHVEGVEIIPMFPRAMSIDENRKNLSAPFFNTDVIALYVMREAKRLGIDIIHMHGIIPDILSDFTDLPILKTTHHNYYSYPFNYTRAFLLGEYRQYTSKYYIPNKDVMTVFISKKQKEIAEEYLDGFVTFNDANSRLIYNGIPMDDFECNLHPSDYFLYFGYIDEDKGADNAVQIARKAGIRLKISGVYDTSSSFFDEKIKPFLNDKIEFIGPVNPQERGKLLGSAKAMLFPLRWNEPFGLTVVESMASGTPVIAYNRGSMPEIIQNSINGFVVETEDEFLQAIGKIDNIDREQCRISVQDKFSVKRMTEDYINLYQSLLSK